MDPIPGCGRLFEAGEGCAAICGSGIADGSDASFRGTGVEAICGVNAVAAVPVLKGAEVVADKALFSSVITPAEKL